MSYPRLLLVLHKSCFPTQNVGTLSCWYSFLLVLFPDFKLRLLVLFLLVFFPVGTLSYFLTQTVGTLSVGTLSVGTLSCFLTQTVGTLSVGTLSCFLFSQIPVGTLSVLTLSSPPLFTLCVSMT